MFATTSPGLARLEVTFEAVRMECYSLLLQLSPSTLILTMGDDHLKGEHLRIVFERSNL